MLQGWPILHSFWQEHLNMYANDNSGLQNLAGDAFPGTVIQAIVAAMLFSLDFISEPEDEVEDICVTTEDTVAALDLLNRCKA